MLNAVLGTFRPISVFRGRNLHAYAERLDFAPELEEWQRLLLCDPQTSGGLLIAFP